PIDVIVVFDYYEKLRPVWRFAAIATPDSPRGPYEIYVMDVAPAEKSTRETDWTAAALAANTAARPSIAAVAAELFGSGPAVSTAHPLLPVTIVCTHIDLQAKESQKMWSFTPIGNPSLLRGPFEIDILNIDPNDRAATSAAAGSLLGISG